jgi:hypothetical protein
MLKDIDKPKEKARNKAERRWANADKIKRLKEAEQRPQLVDPNKEPEIAEIITNQGRVDGQINRFESKFKKEIRTMMKGYAAKNLQLYAAFLDHRRYRLLKEKLRRLKLAQQAQGD